MEKILPFQITWPTNIWFAISTQCVYITCFLHVFHFTRIVPPLKGWDEHTEFTSHRPCILLCHLPVPPPLTFLTPLRPHMTPPSATGGGLATAVVSLSSGPRHTNLEHVTPGGRGQQMPDDCWTGVCTCNQWSPRCVWPGVAPDGAHSIPDARVVRPLFDKAPGV